MLSRDILHKSRLYGFVDSACLAGRRPAEMARQLCDGGVDIIQLRAKDWSRERTREAAEEVLAVTNEAGVLLIINDFADIALGTNCGGLHLGQEDFFGRGFEHKTEVFPAVPGPILGLSTHGPDDAQRAVAAGADYVGVGPVYPTGTKPGVRAVTLDYVRWASAHLGIPWFAIGGITLQNLPDVMAAGGRRICVVSAILNASNPTEACRAFREQLDRAPLP